LRLRVAAFLPPANSNRSSLAKRSMKRIVFSILALTLPVFAQPWRTGYYYQPGTGTLPISAVPFSKYTHVIEYAMLPTPSGNTCGIDVNTYAIAANADKFISTAHASGTKALVSMLNDSAATAMKSCTSSAHLSQFVSVIANFINQHKYDGFDIDWEGGVVDSQYQQFILSLRSAMPNKILTVATVWNQRNVISQVQDSLDQINLMNYDDDAGLVSGNWATTTIYNSALYQGPASDWQTADAMIYYNVSQAGISPSKIGLGIPFYGRIKRGCRS
jgi:chitinase